MPTLNEAIGAFERHIGFNASRARTISRRLQESGLLPLGAPGVAPQMSRDHFLNLFVALAADTWLHNAVGAVREYAAMTPGGTDLTGAPDRIPTAQVQLAAMFELALEDDRDVRGARIEVVSNWPEIAAHWPDGAVERFQPVGTQPGHWQGTKFRKSITVNGAAFADAARAIFGGQ